MMVGRGAFIMTEVWERKGGRKGLEEDKKERKEKGKEAGGSRAAVCRWCGQAGDRKLGVTSEPLAYYRPHMDRIV